MKIAALQMVSTTRVDANLETAWRLIAQAAREGAELVVLPEYFCLMGRGDRDKLAIAEAAMDPVPDPAMHPTMAPAVRPATHATMASVATPAAKTSPAAAATTAPDPAAEASSATAAERSGGGPAPGPIQRMLAEAAREHGVWLIGGTLPLGSSDPGRVLNSNCVYAPDGRLAARYDKIHLFRYDNGRERYDEGAAILAGASPTAFEIPPAAAADGATAGSPGTGLRVGLSVCYDLRFPELYRALSFATAQKPCDLISVPSAFTHTTGLAHWELLLRARAVENQCYVIAAAQGGLHENGRRTFGHSLIVDPWGEVLGMLPEGEGVVMAELDPARLAAVRSQLPALQHRRIGAGSDRGH